MPWLIHNLNTVADRWAGLAWAVVWQSTLIIGIAALFAALLLRRASPSVRFWLWQVLAIKLLVMPFWTYAIPFTASPAWSESVSPAVMRAAFPQAPAAETIPAGDRSDRKGVNSRVERPSLPNAPGSAAQPHLTWPGFLLAAWIVVAAWHILRLVTQRVRLSILLRHTMPADPALATVVGETASKLKLSHVPTVVLIDDECSPFVCGIFHPLFVLPRSLAETLTPLQLRHVAAHELAHIRRRDLVWGWFTEFARIVHVFNPAVHWLCYRLRLERELACDQIAMAATGQNPAAYADTLVQVAAHSSQPALFCASSGERDASASRFVACAESLEPTTQPGS